jgi:CheY-like chemotaxis protein
MGFPPVQNTRSRRCAREACAENWKIVSIKSPSKHSKPLRVLLAEDNPADVILIREALSSRFENVELAVQEDGEQMIHMIEMLERGETPRPDVILMDLGLPRVTGDVALARLHRCEFSSDVPVVVVSSSDAAGDRATATRLGARSYFRKPNDYDEFMKLGDLVGAILVSQ